MESIDVSVIITTRNEEKHIKNCLESIIKQTYPQDKIEIIVVDNNSEDSTKDLAKAYTDKVYNFGSKRAAQLNFGVRLAKGAYILFPDADMILSEDILSECVKKCELEGLDALYIPERIVGKGFWIKARDFERSFYNASCIDCVRFVRRERFLELDGFDENLDFGPDDWDFDRRVRETGRMGTIEAPIYHNEGGFSFRKYLNKKTYYITSFNKYIQKWGCDDPVIKKQFGLLYRYFRVYLENGKWKRLLMHPVLTLGLYFLRFMVGLQYISATRSKNISSTLKYDEVQGRNPAAFHGKA